MQAMRAAHIAIAATIPATLAMAGGPRTWTFDVTTEGENVSWLSPTAVDPSAGAFRGDYQLEAIVITAELFGLPVPVDVTDQVPPELRWR